MVDLDYLEMSGFGKFCHNFKKGLKAFPKKLGGFFVKLLSLIVGMFVGIWNGLKDIGKIFVVGNWSVKLSFLVMGFAQIIGGQFARGILFLIIEIAFIAFLALFGAGYLSQLGTLGSATQQEIWNEDLGVYEYLMGDNSMLILLYSVVSLIIIAFFVATYIMSIKQQYVCYYKRENGQKLPNANDDLKDILNEKFHTTLLALPTLGLILFTVLPTIFMVLIAFTNYDRMHMPPGNLFTWVGLQNFRDMLFMNPQMSMSFWRILGWTLVWAFFATFTNYILGMILAMLINKKGIKRKKLFRNLFVVTIAVPQFVSLLLMRNLLHDDGQINVLLQQLGIISQPIQFLTNTTMARISVILVNVWVGVPYTMLITTGILMNIPAELYESARIDGANPVQTYVKITLPYVLFVTGPYLITQFIGNINNFNVIWLLTGGGPLSLDYFYGGGTDLLVTWLYRLTVDQNNYKLASVIGILTFVICAVMSLVVYNNSAAVKKEEEFQ